MSVDLWTLDLSVLNSLGVDTLKMDGQSRKDLIKVWRMMLGFKNFPGHVSTISIVIHQIMFHYS